MCDNRRPAHKGTSRQPNVIKVNFEILSSLHCTHAHFIFLIPQEEIPDILRNGHCFSDGVGEISLELLRLCLAEVSFGYKSVEDVSAIQVGWALSGGGSFI